MRGSQAPSSTALIAVLDLALRDAGAKAAAVAAREAVRARESLAILVSFIC